MSSHPVLGTLAWRQASRAVARLALMGAAVGSGVSTASAQVVTVDEGSFTVTRGGARLGREEFRIVRQPSAAAGTYVARATGSYGERRITPALQADGDGSPERYQVEVRRAGTVEQRVTAQASGTHFRAQVQLDGGEAAREYILEPGTVVLDEELYHQYYFLARRVRTASGATRVPVLTPRRNAQSPLWVTLDGTERLTVGGRTVDARHYVLTDRAGGRRELWADDQGRVLRVLLPSEGVEALRDDAPR